MMENEILLLSAYLDNELTDAERADLEARLQTDPALRAELAELEQVIALVKTMPVLKAPRNYTLDPALYSKPRKVITYPWRQLVAVAAAIVIVMGGLFLALSTQEQDQNSKESVGVDEGQEVPGSEIAGLPTFASTLRVESTLEDVSPAPAVGQAQEIVPSATSELLREQGDNTPETTSSFAAGGEAPDSATGLDEETFSASDAANSAPEGFADDGLIAAPDYYMPQVLPYNQVVPSQEPPQVAQSAAVAPPMQPIPGSGGAPGGMGGGAGEGASPDAIDPVQEAAEAESVAPFLPSGSAGGGGGGAGGGVTTLNTMLPPVTPSDTAGATSIFGLITDQLNAFMQQLSALWR